MTPKDFIKLCADFNKKHKLGAKFDKVKKGDLPTVGQAETAIDAIEPLIPEDNAELKDGYNALFDVWEKYFNDVDPDATAGKTIEGDDQSDPGAGGDGNDQPKPEEGDPGAGGDDSSNNDGSGQPGSKVNPGDSEEVKAARKKAIAKKKREENAKEKAKKAAELAKLVDPKDTCILDIYAKLSKESISELKPGTMIILLEILKK